MFVANKPRTSCIFCGEGHTRFKRYTAKISTRCGDPLAPIEQVLVHALFPWPMHIVCTRERESGLIAIQGASTSVACFLLWFAVECRWLADWERGRVALHWIIAARFQLPTSSVHPLHSIHRLPTLADGTATCRCHYLDAALAHPSVSTRPLAITALRPDPSLCHGEPKAADDRQSQCLDDRRSKMGRVSKD